MNIGDLKIIKQSGFALETGWVLGDEFHAFGRVLLVLKYNLHFILNIHPQLAVLSNAPLIHPVVIG
jgi:hypothetical protein